MQNIKPYSMRVFLPLFLLVSFSLAGQTKLKFEKLAPMPIGAQAFGYSQNGDDLYAFGGFSDHAGFSNHLQVYDNRIDLWLDVRLKNLPQLRFPSSIYLKEHGGILLAGGIKRYGSSLIVDDSVRMIYTANDRYITRNLGHLPIAGKNMGIAHSENKVYFFGGSVRVRIGFSGTPYYRFNKKMYEYDLKSGDMSELPDMPLGMETKGGIVDGNLYVLGGFDGNPRSFIWKYDIDKKIWHELASLEAPTSAYALTQYKHYIILVGDYYHGDRLVVYDTKKESTRYFTMNFQGRHMGASIINDELHVYGGRSGYQGLQAWGQHYKIAIKELIGNKESVQ